MFGEPGEHIPACAPVRREVPQVRESLRHRPGSRRKRALMLLQVVWHFFHWKMIERRTK